MKFKDFKNYIDDLEKKTEESNASFQKAKNLEAILSITKRINQFLILEDVLKSVLKHAIEINSTDRGFIVLRDKNDELNYKMDLDSQGNFLSESDFKVSTTVVKDVFKTGESRFMEDAQSDRDNKTSKSIYNLELKTILCSPLVIDQKNRSNLCRQQIAA